jgi:hypothetical protein
MVDDTEKDPIKTEQVMFVTLREVIEGTLFHNENVRLSDALNAESRHHSRYITLKDATIYSISTGREILKTGFLLVSHSHVIYMTPKGCVQMSATANTQAALKHTARRSAEAAAVRQSAPSDDEAAAAAWRAIPAPSGDVESAAAASAPDVLGASRFDYHFGEEAGSMARQAVVQGTDVHLMSRQAMLDTLSAIRGHTTEPPRRESRMVK